MTFPSLQSGHNAMVSPSGVVSRGVQHPLNVSPYFKATCSWYKAWYFFRHCSTDSFKASSLRLASRNMVVNSLSPGLGFFFGYWGTRSIPLSGYPRASRVVNDMLRNTLSILAGIRSLSVPGDVVVFFLTNFCICPLRARPFYGVGDFEASGASRECCSSID